MATTLPLAPVPPRRKVTGHALLTAAALAAACGAPPPHAAESNYVPRTREITVTTVPLLVREAKGLYPFLAKDFAPGGVLDGKEVYGYSPSTLVAVEGDTIHFTLINPEDDQHGFLIPDCTADDVGSFVLPDCGVALPPQQVTHATYVARRAGIYPFMCSVAKHLPMMSGQLVVLSAAAVAGAERIRTAFNDGSRSLSQPGSVRLPRGNDATGFPDYRLVSVSDRVGARDPAGAERAGHGEWDRHPSLGQPAGRPVHWGTGVPVVERRPKGSGRYAAIAPPHSAQNLAPSARAAPQTLQRVPDGAGTSERPHWEQ